MDDSQLFILRVWKHQDQFRASVRGTREVEARLFTEPGQVAEFLVEIVAARSGPMRSNDTGEVR